MSEQDLSDWEKQREKLAELLLESMCTDAQHIVLFEDAGVKLILTASTNEMECMICGKRWESNLEFLFDSQTSREKAFPFAYKYWLSLECPAGCNKESRWKKNIYWILILKEED
jgi:hypothetical protein